MNYRTDSCGAEALLFHLRAAGLRAPVTEFRFHPDRRWRADFAWPDAMLLVEYEGGVYANGRHTRGRGFEDDCDKYNTATCQGWRVLRFTAKHVRNGTALQMIEEVLNARS